MFFHPSWTRPSSHVTLFTAALFHSGLPATLRCAASPNTVNSSFLLHDQDDWRPCCTAIDSDKGSGIESSVGPSGVRGRQRHKVSHRRNHKVQAAERRREWTRCVWEHWAGLLLLRLAGLGVVGGVGWGDQHLCLSQWAVPECGSHVMRCHAICFHFGPQTDIDSSCTFMISDVKREKSWLTLLSSLVRKKSGCILHFSADDWQPSEAAASRKFNCSPNRFRTRTHFDSVTFPQFSSINGQVAAAGLLVANLVSYQQIKAGRVLPLICYHSV